MRCSTLSRNKLPTIDALPAMNSAPTNSEQDAADARLCLGTMRELIGWLDRQHQHQADQLAAQVHAQLGSALTALTMRVALLARKSSSAQVLSAPSALSATSTPSAASVPPNQAAHWEKVHALLATITESTRDLQRQLRPFAIDALGFSASLSDYLQQFSERTGMIGTLQLSGAAPDWSADDAHAVLRIVQEALNNASQHAHATKVVLHLNALSTGYKIEIVDDGAGFDLAALDWHRSHGLRLMRERAALLHAHLDIASAPGKGCRIRLSLLS